MTSCLLSICDILSSGFQIQVTPTFWTFVKPLHVYEKPTLVPVFTNQRKAEEDVCSDEKKKARSEISIQAFVCSELL